MKSLSVVIAAYNAAPYLRETLDSVLAQDYPAVEVIVIDDGSKDDTAAVCRAYGNRIEYRHQANSGRGAIPRNRGYRIAKGDYICFFDSDDVMAAGRLSTQARFLDAHAAALAVLSDYRNFDERGPAPQTHFATCPQLCRAAGFDRGLTEAVLDGAVARAILTEENFSITSSGMYRRTVLERVGAFDESLKASEDFDLVFRVARAGSLGVLSMVGFDRRLHQNNLSWDEPRIIENLIRSRARLLQDEPSALHRRKLRHALSGLYRSSAVFNAKSRRGPWLEPLLKSITVGHTVSWGLAMDSLRCLWHRYWRRTGPRAAIRG